AGIGCVDNWLAFGSHKGNWNTRWHGGVATVVESQGDEVWGVVWKLAISSLDSLDIQEEVDGGVYQPIEINVQTPDGELACRCYQMNQCVYGLTSPQYKQVIYWGSKCVDSNLYKSKLFCNDWDFRRCTGPLCNSHRSRSGDV
ncbi:hypothetical protein AB205_0094330, partial [Aquarana catesbeiana]